MQQTFNTQSILTEKIYPYTVVDAKTKTLQFDANNN